MGKRLALLPTAGLGLSLLGAGVAGYLTVEHGGGASPLCVFGQGCQVVAQSTYAQIGVVPTAALGLAMYLALAVLYGVRLVSSLPGRVERFYQGAGLALALAGTGVSAWLTYVELYVLHAVCIWCVVSAATVALLLAVAVADLRSSLHRITPLPSSATRGATGEGA